MTPTPEEKAKQLVEKFLNELTLDAVDHIAKDCAKVCCQEIIAVLPPILGRESFGPNSPMSKEEAVSNPAIDYWSRVLTEIDIL